MEVDEEEDPPLLVDGEALAEHYANAARVRVPITIVTGMHAPQSMKISDWFAIS